MVTEIIAKDQGSLLFMPASLDDVHVMSLGPSDRPMEEGTKRIIRMRFVNVTDGLEPVAVRRKRLQCSD